MLPLKQLSKLSKMEGLDIGCIMDMFLNVYLVHHNISHYGNLIYSMSK